MAQSFPSIACMSAEDPTFVQRLEKGIQRLSSGLSSSHAGALIQVWMPEVCPRGRVLLSTEGLPFSISGIGDLLALFRCISCKYRFDADPKYGDTMGAIGRVFHYGKPEMCLDVQQYDQNTYLRVQEAHVCRIHSTLIFPVFDGDAPRPSAVVEISHHDESVELSQIVRVSIEALKDVGLKTKEIRSENVKLGLRKWPVEVCSVPLSNIEDSLLPKKHPDERGISVNHGLGIAMQTGFGQVSEFIMNMGMESLAMDGTSVCSDNNEASFDFHTQKNTYGPFELERNMDLHRMNSDMLAAGFSPQVHNLSRSSSESGSATSSQLPEMHSIDNFMPAETGGVCQASVPMADIEANCDMHSDFLKQESFKSDSKDDKSDDEGKTEAKKKENRLAGGAGKRLTYRELEIHFGHGLKEAARRLGICPTTLKRACRRNGINRWPSRQISKLLKVWKQMGYKGEPPSWLLQNAISGNLRSENLAYILSAGLHVGLDPQRCNCETQERTSKNRNSMFMQNMHQNALHSNGSLAMDDDITMKNMTHHGAFTAALHSNDDTFGLQDGQGRNHNHTWHAGQMTSILLQPSSFGCPTTMGISPEMHFKSQMVLNKSREDPLLFDMERTQRGGSGVAPVLSEFSTPLDDDVLLQPFHLPLTFETQNLFH